MAQPFLPTAKSSGLEKRLGTKVWLWLGKEVMLWANARLTIKLGGSDQMKNRRDRKRIRILLADDHPIVREGIAALIARHPDLHLVAEAADGHEAVRKYLECRPDVALLDLRMNGVDGVRALSDIRRHDPKARALFLSVFCSEEDVHRAFSAGARGYLLKDASAEDLVTCIRRVADGLTCIPSYVASKLANHVRRHDLSVREREVLRLVAQGKSNKEIASLLLIAEGTVKVHVDHILKKLGVHGRFEAAAMALQLGVVHLDTSDV